METPQKPKVVEQEEVVFNPGPGYEPKIWSPLLDPKQQAAVKEWEEKYQAGVKARLANRNEKKRLAELGINKTPSQVREAKRKFRELDLMSPLVNKLTSPNSPFLYKKTESKLVNGPAGVSRTLFAEEEATSGGRRSKRRRQTKKQIKRRRQTRRR